jgi:hypothetical protein
MIATAKTRVLLVVAVCSLVLPLAGGSASAEDGTVYSVRDQCVDQVGGGYAGIYGNAESNYGRARSNVYSSCMRSHGMRP